MRRPGRARGFSLLELLAVIAIVAIGASVAAPSFSKMIANGRAKGTSSELFASLVRARSEAIRVNASVTITPVIAGQWGSGWRIANPNYANEYFEIHEAVLNTTISGPNSVTYLSNGRISGTTAPEFEIATTNATSERCIKLDLSGRPYQKSSSC